MAITPEEIIEDLIRYISLYGLSISKEAKKTLQDIEEFSLKCNYPCNYLLFFSKSIKNSKELQKLFYDNGINPNLAALMLEIKYYDSIDPQNTYQKGSKLYSYIYDRAGQDKTAILDKALQYCVRDERTIIENRDIIFSAMDYFEKMSELQKEMWKDTKLHTDVLTLSHLCGKFEKELWISFKEIRENFTTPQMKISGLLFR